MLASPLPAQYNPAQNNVYWGRGSCQFLAGRNIACPGCAYYGSATLGGLYIEGPQNWAWMFPDGGVTPYPGLPGSGVIPQSDYSCLNWVVPPSVNARGVAQRLEEMNIPRVAPEPEFLGKNTFLPKKLKLPIPQNWLKEDKENDQNCPKPSDDKDKDKDKDLDKDANKDKEQNKDKDRDEDK